LAASNGFKFTDGPWTTKYYYDDPKLAEAIQWYADLALVKGFALTLALGVGVSMFSAIVVTRTLLKVMVGTSVMRHLWLFGHDVELARGALTPTPIRSTSSGAGGS